jgi:hypothetical protein
MRLGPFPKTGADPLRDTFTFLLDFLAGHHLRRRPIKDRNRSLSTLIVSVHIGNAPRQKAVRLRTDLVRCAVVYAEGEGATPNVETKRLPRKGLLENPLAKVAGEEETVALATG